MMRGYLTYWLRRKSVFKIHSPFVYDFMKKVLNDSGANRDYDTILRISRLMDKRQRRNRWKRKQSRMLYRLVRYFEPDAVVCFGSMSAMNTSALALGTLQTKVYLEESADFLELMNSMGIVNVRLIQPDEFDSERFKQLNTGLVYFSSDAFGDENWDYLDDCLLHKTNESVFVFEGIHRNGDIEEAWEQVKEREDVSLTMDIFSHGLVFFHDGIEKQDFVLKY